MAFLVPLESLSPVERSVFLLREVSDYDYLQIARILGKSEVNCRQMLRRARQHIAARRPRFDPSPQAYERLMQQFLKASADGDLQGLITLLAEDVTLCSDGGGKASAALRPIRGADRVVRFMLGALRKFVPAERVSRPAEVNGQPGIITDLDRRPISLLVPYLVDGRIQTIFIVSNPEKLAGLPSLSAVSDPSPGSLVPDPDSSTIPANPGSSARDTDRAGKSPGGDPSRPYPHS